MAIFVGGRKIRTPECIPVTIQSAGFQWELK